ncbi:MAG: helix-turn-helix transcriptional regulator [Acidimicrobiia bacterium]|nr:helix-turn-helix transcriptional regulator [Acidimicrobiia bacterium]
MNPLQAVKAMAALAHKTRLAVFRSVVSAGPEGLPAGTIALRLRVTPSTLSHHLAVLERAGLLASRRVQRQILYACAYPAMKDLLQFLSNDCCQGHPDLCGFEETPIKIGRSSKRKSGRAGRIKGSA